MDWIDRYHYPEDGTAEEVVEWSINFLRLNAELDFRKNMHEFSHSTFSGVKFDDGTTSTGKLSVPDEVQPRKAFARAVCSRYLYRSEERLCCTYTENALPIHPLIFDFDFLAKKEAPEVFNQTFWERLGELVIEVLSPDAKRLPFELIIFTAHGFHSERQMLKYSYHVILKNVVIISFVFFLNLV